MASNLLQSPQYSDGNIPCYPGNLWIADALLKERLRAELIGDKEYCRALSETKRSVVRYPFLIRDVTTVPLMGITKRVREYLAKQPNFAGTLKVPEGLSRAWFNRRLLAANSAVPEILENAPRDSLCTVPPTTLGLAWPRIVRHNRVTAQIASMDQEKVVIQTPERKEQKRRDSGSGTEEIPTQTSPEKVTDVIASAKVADQSRAAPTETAIVPTGEETITVPAKSRAASVKAKSKSEKGESAVSPTPLKGRKRKTAKLPEQEVPSHEAASRSEEKNASVANQNAKPDKKSAPLRGLSNVSNLSSLTRSVNSESEMISSGAQPKVAVQKAAAKAPKAKGKAQMRQTVLQTRTRSVPGTDYTEADMAVDDSGSDDSFEQSQVSSSEDESQDSDLENGSKAEPKAPAEPSGADEASARLSVEPKAATLPKTSATSRLSKKPDGTSTGGADLPQPKKRAAKKESIAGRGAGNSSEPIPKESVAAKKAAGVSTTTTARSKKSGEGIAPSVLHKSAGDVEKNDTAIQGKKQSQIGITETSAALPPVKPKARETATSESKRKGSATVEPSASGMVSQPSQKSTEGAGTKRKASNVAATKAASKASVSGPASKAKVAEVPPMVSSGNLSADASSKSAVVDAPVKARSKTKALSQTADPPAKSKSTTSAKLSASQTLEKSTGPADPKKTVVRSQSKGDGEPSAAVAKTKRSAAVNKSGDDTGRSKSKKG